MQRLLLGDVSKIKEAALEEARRKAEAIISSARKEAEEIINKVRVEAGREAKEIIAKAERDGIEEARRIESRALREAKLMLSKVKAELVEGAFSRAWNLIVSSLKKDPELSLRILEDLIVQGVKELEEDVGLVEVLLNEGLAGRRGEVKKKINELLGGRAEVKVSERGLGAIIYASDGRVYVEATLEGRFERVKRELRPLFLKGLTGGGGGLFKG